jgi:hypothetical protein
MTRLPLPIRNRLAATILAALADPEARRCLETLGTVPGACAAWLGPEEQGHATMLRARALRAAQALSGRVFGAVRTSMEEALDAAAALFDAGLFFETHEVLEPHWRQARGEARDVLQGLIQVAVGYQHWANANVVGARSLLEEGIARLRGRHLAGMDFNAFAGAVETAIGVLPRLPGMLVPPFPRRG